VRNWINQITRAEEGDVRGWLAGRVCSLTGRAGRLEEEGLCLQVRCYRE